MAKKNGNGQHGTISDLMVGVVEELGEVRKDLHRIDGRFERLTRMMSKVGDVLAEHERRIDVLEANR